MALHWLSAMVVAGLLGWGLYMVDLPKGPDRSWAFGVHKSLGLLAVLLVLVRVAWCARHPAPVLAGIGRGVQRLAAAAHRLLYALLFAVPLAGLASASFTPYPLKFFGLALPKPGRPDPALNELLSGLHGVLAWALAAVIILHVAAAARHLLRGDGVVQRMLPGRPKPAGRGSR
jgi:cytochrome b561